MKVLVINCGSSSIKYKLFDFPAGCFIYGGCIERIGERASRVRNHHQGIELLIANMLRQKIIKDLSEISAIGHRVVHGGESFRQPHLIDTAVIKKIREFIQLAPLHNPVNLEGIISCRKFFPHIRQVAVFDTAFHQSISRTAFMYAVPFRYYQQYKVRKYGFHGTSHQFVAGKAAGLLGRPLNKLKLITCHLGNGCSIAAVNRGESVDTSMGFTPLEGLMMGTRCGDIDVAAVFYLMEKENIAIPEMDKILNKQSGLLGISGLSNDFRAIKKALQRRNVRAKLAYEMFIYRIKKYIGAYWFILGGADAVCLTGGIGENARDLIGRIRRDVRRVCGGKTKVLVVPTDEELMIASLTYKLIRKKR